MQQRLLVNPLLFMTIFVGIETLLYGAQVKGEDRDDTSEEVIPWSSKAQGILEKEAHRFNNIEHFCFFRYSWDDIRLKLILFTFCLFLTTYVSIRPIFSRRLALHFILVRLLIALSFFLILVDRMLTNYALRAGKGYFFITDKGLLIIAPGDKEKFIWLSYQDIESIDVLFNPSNPSRAIIAKKSLRITDSAGRERDYQDQWFAAPFVFQEFYTRLIAIFKRSKAIKHKKSHHRVIKHKK